jgi:glutathione synthase/RimK-type ligase-like ATP-grasp enzyme
LIKSAEEAKVIWWRRPRALQELDSRYSDINHQNLINNDCHGSLSGGLQSCFSGKWISNPLATETASNKLLQLLVAKRNGFRIPATLVTQSPQNLRLFHEKNNKKIILKPVVGTPGPLLFTQFVREEHLVSADSIRVCPAIYQEYIPGSRHIRLNCFGSHSFASSIETTDLDWRPNLSVPIAKWIVPDQLHLKVRRVLDDLGLEMGIFDFKECPTGELVWLEVNPQGQFMFLEGLTGEPLTEYFADYLEEELGKVCSQVIPSESQLAVQPPT